MEINTYSSKAPIKKSLYVYNVLINKIMTTEWEFGKKIIVNDLIDSLNVSRRPIMDALKMLETEGFLEIIPQSGCYLITPTKKEIIDQLLLSSTLEALCADLAAKNSSSKEIENLLVYNNKFVKNPGEISNNFEYYSYNRQIHFTISDMTHSTRIPDYSRLMWNLNDFFLTNTLPFESERIYNSIHEHDEIITAISNRDSDLAKSLMQKHLHGYIRLIEKMDV